MDNKKIGFTIGKFAPFHKGHEYLIETALKEMDKFYVVIYETDLIKNPIEERKIWIQEKYPEVEILYAKNPPKQYGLDKKSVDIQMQYLCPIIKQFHPTHFYSSEQYGRCVAEYLNIVDRRVDEERKANPISATEIRKNIKENKKWLDEKIYKDYITKK